MTTKNKLLKRFLDCPDSLKFRQIERLLLWIGFERVQAKGSHVKFCHHACNIKFPIAVHNGDCKNCYKRLVARIIKDNFYLND